MDYFKNFPTIAYAFGNEASADLFRNISIYSTVIDEIKDNISFYNNYTIQEFERADQLSQRLYGTPSFHWTFYLVNNHIRERGWPLSNRDLILKAQKEYPYTTLTTTTTLTDRFRLGQTVTGNTSGASGVIDHRHLNIGQLIIKGVSGTFVDGETVSSLTIVDRPEKPINTVETIALTSSGPEYLSAHHYINGSSERVDIDPTVGPGALLTEVTYLDRYVEFNDELKEIKVIKPSRIIDVTNSFKEALAS